MDNVLQNAHDCAKNDLFGKVEDNIRYAYEFQKAIHQKQHHVPYYLGMVLNGTFLSKNGTANIIMTLNHVLSSSHLQKIKKV